MNKKLEWVLKYNIDNNNEYRDFVFTGKYLAVQRPLHHKARSDGYVYIHQLQAEKKLGRKLNENECVHHIDENKYNNALDNIIVFKTKSDHAAFHSGCDIYLDGDVWVAKAHKKHICPICKNNTKDIHADMCISCYLKKKSSNIPPKEILMDLILEYPMTQIGKMYGVSGNSVKKWCKKYGLPFLKNDIAKLK